MRRPASDEAHVREEIARTRQFFDKSRPSVVGRPSPLRDYVFTVTSKLIPPGRPGWKAVDLGCHWGRYTRAIALTYGRVIGVDFSEQAIASADKGPNIYYLAMDLNSPESGLSGLAPVNFFLANAGLEMLEDPARLCRQLAACASPGAQLLAVIPNRRSLNYITFRAGLWVATRLLGKRGGIYNNGITIAKLVDWLEAAGFTVENRGAIIGVPAHLVGFLPVPLQKRLLTLDEGLLRVLGGSYHWVIATKAPRADEAR